VKIAIVQTCSSDDLAANLAAAGAGIAEAASRGAELVALPENFAFMRREGAPFPCVQGPDGEIVGFLREAAREHGLWLLGGSFPEAIPDAAPGETRVYNTSIVVGPDGGERARYRKIHLFDVDLGADGENRYRESDHFAPGRDVVIAETPFGGLGLSICYDLRFPELYRLQAERGAKLVAVPSAFMPETGRDHWEVLLRSRAIENQVWVIAPAQCGQHTADRASYGRSMIIDPWGIVLAQAADRPAVIVADCDPSELERIRGAVPCLTNRRLANAPGGH
jgi:predicted amidohydrolase